VNFTARLWPLAIVLALLGCQVPPLDEVAGGKPCDGDAGHDCAPGYQCCQGSCIGEDQPCCQPESDAAFCARLGRICGVITDTDNCGDARTANCGSETDAAFCARYGKQCGTFSGTDLCGFPRTATCGTCTTAPNLTCQNNTCICSPETASQLCTRLGVQCGTATGMDNCGTTRTVSCPMCTAPSTCGGEGTAGRCGCIAAGSTGCLTSGTVCCDGSCNSNGKCCLAVGDPCTATGQCCQGTCGTVTGTCCRPSGGICSFDDQCCGGICDQVTNKCSSD
jgi:hypothetical protein